MIYRWKGGFFWSCSVLVLLSKNIKSVRSGFLQRCFFQFFFYPFYSPICLVVENMAGQKEVVGGQFEELQRILELVKDKEHAGICLDTCHAFAAGKRKKKLFKNFN